ncbi:MAG: DUF805 domain-containing protein [Pseudomonadota bacterium]
MSPFDYMTVSLRRYADFSGRSRRMEYWMFVIFNIMVSFAASIIDMVAGTATAIGGVTGVFSALVFLALLIPGIAVTVRRLHDQDKSGWWFLIIFIPLLGAIVLLVFMFLEGTKGDNRFGSDPKEAVV